MTTRAKVRRITLDLHPDDTRAPAPGDVLVTARTVNRVTGARPVDSQVWCNRWLITVQHLRGRDVDERRSGSCRTQPAEGGRTYITSLYRPGEGPVDRFGARS